MRPFETDRAIAVATEQKRAAGVELQAMKDRLEALREKAAEVDQAAIRARAAERMGKLSKKACQEAQDAAKAVRTEGEQLEQEIAVQEEVLALHDQEIGKARVASWKRVKADLEARHLPALTAFVEAMQAAQSALVALQEVEGGFKDNAFDMPPYAVTYPGEISISSHGIVHATVHQIEERTRVAIQQAKAA